MSFREIDEESNFATRPTGGSQRWLREIFLEDWTLKLIALAITFSLWYGVTGQRKLSTVRLRDVHLNFQLPKDMEVSNEPRNEVEVTLTGNKHVLERIIARDLTAYVDVTDLKAGESVVQLNSERVTLGLPEGVRLDDLEPNSVLLRLEPRLEREVEVEARYEGAIPEGYELRGITLVPNKVKVRGPASRVNVLEKVLTEIISLNGRKESFIIPQIAVSVSDQRVNLLDPVISARVEIGERHIEKSFTGVAVRTSSGAEAQPETASVTLYGARSAIEQLRAEDISIFLDLDVDSDGSFKPRLALPSGMEGRIELRSTKPSGFSIAK